MKYQRFVAYVYEYRKGKKENNCGFLRVEARNENITVEVHLKVPGLPSDEKCSIYGFVRNGGLMEGNLLGCAWSGAEKLDCMIESEKMEDNSWKKDFPQFGGIVILTEHGAFLGTEWDDQPIKPENFQEKKQQKESVEEKKITKDDDEEKTSADDGSITDIKIDKREEIVREESSASFTAQEINEGGTQTSHTYNYKEQNMESQKEPAFCPFNDDEISECRKIHPSEFFNSCPRACGLRNNRFLEHGYYNFGHLLVGKRADGQQILGVPGGYDQQERFMANMFGFPYFKESHEIQLPGGRGGYWYRLINPANFH